MATKHLSLVATVALLYAARRYFRNWGTTKEESRMRLPGDEQVGRPVVATTEAVWINASAAAVWPWLRQIGQDRAGLYTGDRLAAVVRLRQHNADRIHSEWQRLAPGDVVRLVPKGWLGLRDGIALEVVEVVEARSIVLRTSRTNRLWDSVWSFHLIPHWDDRCRLLIRTRTRLRHPGDALAVELAAPAKAFLTRGALRGIKRRAESLPAPEAATPTSEMKRVV